MYSNPPKPAAGAGGEQKPNAPANLPEPIPTPDPNPAERSESQETAPETTAGTDQPACGPARRQPFLITLEQATELGLINSREYQDRREDLYLAALPVTLERFAFLPQFFAFGQIIRERTGRDTAEGSQNRYRFNTATGFSQLFSTGALLLFRFANQTVVNLTGTQKHTLSQSTINLDFIQPLLQGGGRAVTLEPLTQVERNLLYVIRDYARFRKEFFVNIAAGESLTRGTVSSPSVFIPGATPLAVPVGGGAFNVVLAPGQGGRLGAVGLANVLGVAGVGGYLPTILIKAQLGNEYQNVRELEKYLTRFRAFKEGGIVDQVQVGQVEQQLLRSQTTILQREADYGDALDRFKIQLGLPTGLPIDLATDPLRPMFAQIRRYDSASNDYRAAVDQIEQYDRPDEAKLLRERLKQLFTTGPLVEGTGFSEQILRRWAVWERLPNQAAVQNLLRDYGRKRRDLLDLKSDLELAGQALAPADESRLRELEFEIDLGDTELVLREYEEQPWTREKDDVRRQTVQVQLFRNVQFLVQTVLQEPLRERLDQIRQAWPDLPPVCVEGIDLIAVEEQRAQTVASQYALINRFDLMNERAQLVDSWRKIAVAANSLLAVLNVEYHLESMTPAGAAQPFNFNASRTSNRLVLNYELPLVRMLERNNYRSALIAFQRQRRALQAAEDVILAQIRAELRDLRQLAGNYTIQKRAVELAYLQVDQALEAFNQPQAPAGPGLPPGTIGPPAAAGRGGDPAALTQQLLGAQTSLLQAQNQLYNFWISYQTARLRLYRDLELMPLDFRGVWIDAIATCHCGPSDPQRPGEHGADQRPDSGRPDGERSEQLPPPRTVAPPAGPPLGPPK